MFDELTHLPLLPTDGVNLDFRELRRFRAALPASLVHAERLEQRAASRVGPWTGRRIAGNQFNRADRRAIRRRDKLARPRDFVFDRIQLRRHDAAGRGGRAAAGVRGWRAIHARTITVFDHQSPRSNETGNLRVAEFAQQAEHIAIDRLAPHGFASIEIAAH